MPIGEVDPPLISGHDRVAGRLKTGLVWVVLIATAACFGLTVWWLVLLGFASALKWIGIVLTILAVTTIGGLAVRSLLRRRFRFDLRTMFALVSLAALVSWWLASYLPKYAQERRRNRAIALVAKHHRGGPYRQQFDGDDPLLPFEINFSGSKLTDRDLLDLAGHPNLTGLNLRGTLVSDDGLACVSGFRRLASVDVSETSVTAFAIAQLRELPTLSILTLDGNQLRQLATAPDDSLPLVHQLCLESPSIDDEAIVDLERWKNLDSVVVIRGQISDNGLAQLSRLAGLVHLHVEGCPGVSDAGLVHLRSLQQLRLLLVLDTNAAPASGEKLQECLPKCHIIVGARGGPFYEGGPVPRFD